MAVNTSGTRPGKAFTLIMHPGTQNYALHPEHLQALQDYFAPLNGKAVVEVYPRSQAAQATGINLPDNTFRAVTRGNHTICLVGPGETHVSLAWLIAHELAHQLVDTSQTMETAFADAKAQDKGLHPADDHYHQLDPEERFCDGIATNLIGQRLDRDWWRARVGPADPITASYGALPVAVRCIC